MQEDIRPRIPVKEHTFGPGPKNRKERRKLAEESGYFKGRKRHGRSLGGAKVKR